MLRTGLGQDGEWPRPIPAKNAGLCSSEVLGVQLFPTGNVSSQQQKGSTFETIPIAA